jgi:hypothetical protein
VKDFIPRRTMPANLLHEKRSRKADEDYQVQIKDIAKSLLKEYESLLKADFSSTDSAEEFEVIDPKTLQDEQQV